jgi:signal transduction histidine kinase/CheY-like chemotaxis protein
MDETRTLELANRLARPSSRAAAAAALARHLGAEALILFVRDPEVHAFIPAPGLQQTLPGGSGWLDLLRRCEATGQHSGEVAFPDRSTRSSALAISTEDGLILALLGGNPTPGPLHLLCLPILAAVLRAELLAAAAHGRESSARDAAKHSSTLTDVLDATRADLERTLRESRGLNAELKASARAKDEFLAMLAHELRNPLSPIVSALEILRRQGPTAPTFWKLIEVLERQSTHLTRLVDDLLDVSRISRGLIELRQETLALRGALLHASDTVRPIIESQRHLLSLSIPDEPFHVVGDPVRLTQIFANLLTNAAKYTDPGGKIEVTVRREGDQVAVSVRDSGIGIESELLPRVFELFTQAPRALDRSKGGLGIGLTLVKKLVALHRGVIEARSEGPGKGSEFVVQLPLAAAPAERSPATLPGTRLEAPRILLVEDNRDAAEMLAEMLRLSGCQVWVANDGEEGVTKAQELKPEAVVLDIGLPRMDGYTLARKLRAFLPHARLIALSGYGGEEFRARSQHAGFDAYLVKPVELEELLALIGSGEGRR